jgi:hypothetical protein
MNMRIPEVTMELRSKFGAEDGGKTFACAHIQQLALVVNVDSITQVVVYIYEDIL